MSEMTILHLSDIHFKKKEDEENKTFRQQVQQQLIQAVKTHAKKHEAPGYVVVTGDIAFAGKKHEYQEALDFFNQLKTILPDKTEFLPVPGNHDVDRKEIDDIFSLHTIVKERKTIKFLESENKVKNFVNVKFKAYRWFSDQLHPGLYDPEDNYFWVKPAADKNVSFIGLNSAWASESESEHFHIALGFPQVTAALDKAKETRNRILLLHHPLANWLEESDLAGCTGEIFNKCRLILHGHRHVDSAECISTPSDTCIRLGANASYTHDGYIGFQFIRVRFEKDRSAVRVWPYKLETRERTVFLPDTSRWIGQKGKPYFDKEITTPGSEEEEEAAALPPLQIPGEYRDWVQQFHSRMETEQLDPNASARAFRVPLPRLYIPIETTNPFHKPKDERLMKEGGKKGDMVGAEQEDDQKEPAYIDIEQLLGLQNCVLLRGTAGMGKTTLIKHLAYTITQGTGPALLCGSLPVTVFLKDFWPIYEKENKDFLSLLKLYLETRVGGLDPGVVEAFLAGDRALFLLDGLDEVPGHLRRGLVETIAAFRVKYKNNRFLLTGRPHGIDENTKYHFADFLRDIEPLDQKKISTFIYNWFREVSGQAEGVAKVTAAEMMGDIEVNPYVKVFTQNPLLLTAVCILYLDDKRLPDQRVELYRRIVANLLYRRFHQRMAPAKVSCIEDFLKLLAFHMQEHNRRNIDVGEAKQLLKQVFPREDKSLSQYNGEIDGLFEEIEPRCGLLKRREQGEVEFFHLTFQEFLAARHLFYTEGDYRAFLDKPWWEETLLLYLGLINSEWKDRANRLVQEILETSHEDAGVCRRIWLLGAKALRDIHEYKREESVVVLAREKLLDILQTGVSLEERFEAGDILGPLGDPRIQPPPLARVDAGAFTRGSEQHDREKPIQQIYLDAFDIAKYPVSNDEFKMFIKDDGYKNKDFWIPEGWQWREKGKISEPEYWHDRKWNGPNFPVVGVSWYEADAYAKWLSKTTGDKYALPTEAQWEKAARGTRGFIYPWGNEFDEKDRNLCNWAGCGLERTSSVGIFPRDESPYGCMDMAGNVWEWCADWGDSEYYKKSPLKNPKGPGSGSYRVVRGGCWILDHWSCRAAYRGWSPPASRDDVLGFRLVRLP